MVSSRAETRDPGYGTQTLDCRSQSDPPGRNNHTLFWIPESQLGDDIVKCHYLRYTSLRLPTLTIHTVRLKS